MRSVKSNLQKIKGDASFRSFYRKTNNARNSIIVYATKDKEKNLLIYDAINSLLIKNKILAPKLYKESYKKNFIEIEDFGDDPVLKLLKKIGSNTPTINGAISLARYSLVFNNGKVKMFFTINIPIPITG